MLSIAKCVKCQILLDIGNEFWCEDLWVTDVEMFQNNPSVAILSVLVWHAPRSTKLLDKVLSYVDSWVYS